ncbi:esterase family protein [Corynebacterium sp. TA-R-1]|uniref:Esterase family protein n=1 Tax=Corynebacterium stercoris TaxID=2943490 RepID=A0ABT1G1U8_9CORY|nr:alpha/beta hydrolase family protein [Corynebacterium stercoris]MCP1388002.1 esterase family protein [Corynebacterium stercoris]
MKLTRPAAAAVATVALAAVAIPAVTQSRDEAPRTALVQAASSAVTTSLQPQPTTAAVTSASSSAVSATSAAAPSPVVATQTSASKEPNGASVPDGDLQAIANAVDEALTGDTPEGAMENMPTLADDSSKRPTKEHVSRLFEAPKDYQDKPQAWFNQVRALGGEAVSVYSDSMKRDIPVAVLPARDEFGQRVEGAPTYYLLNGAGGSEQNTDWLVQAPENVRDVFKGQRVNVVIPMEGAFSYYIDWLTVPEENIYYRGKQLWTTFLGEELPYAIEDYLGANDLRAVTGFSMSATSSLLLAEHYPNRYAAVGSFSGCAATSTPLPSFFVGLTVNRGSAGKGNITPENLWGPRGSEYNRYNDALVMADKLAGTGTHIYMSSGTGLAAETDMVGYLKNVRKLTSTQALSNSLTLNVEGGAIEGAMNACSHDLHTKLKSLDVPVTFNQRPVGTHSWPLWRDDLAVSWDQVIKPALGL